MSTVYINPASNRSYTNKDYLTIFPEMLELTKLLTSRWDPSMANESDPGKILLKLNAILADKINYNIDKNILEAFPMSLTLITSAKKLYSLLGYEMKWYRSSRCIVNINWTGEVDKKKFVTLPPFTAVADDSGNYVFSLICPSKYNELVDYPTPASSKLYFKPNSITNSYLALQGLPLKYELNGSTVLNITDLDADNRLYFSSIDVAENGIFICNVGSSTYDWVRVDNLITQPAGLKVFKFGVTDDLYSCYIQFPDDAEELFKDGIEVVYHKTIGANGNIPTQTISKFYSDLNIDELTTHEPILINTSNVYMYNSTPATDGEDVEGINEAYKNYKKTIGTFDTLVSLRDYINAVLKTDLVSNCFVSDRNTDPQCSYCVKSIVNGISVNENITEAVDVSKIGIPDGGSQETTFTTHEPSIDAVDIKLYLLNKPTSTDPKSAYYESFELRSNIDDEDTDPVKLALKPYKHIGNNYKDILYTTDVTSRPAMYINVYSIDARVYCKIAVTAQEIIDIKQNIITNIYNSLKSSLIEFGNKIQSDFIALVVELADNRIKSVVIGNIQYDTFARYYEESIYCPFCNEEISSTQWLRNGHVCPSCSQTITLDDWKAAKHYGKFYDTLISGDDSIGYSSEYAASPFDSSTEYNIGDLVTRNGLRYRCIKDHTTAFVSARWELDVYKFNIDYDTFTSALDDAGIAGSGQLKYGKFVELRVVNNPDTTSEDPYVFAIYVDGSQAAGASLSDFGIEHVAGTLDKIGLTLADKISFSISKATQIRDEIYAKSILAGKSKLIQNDEIYMDYNFLNPYETTHIDISEIQSDVSISFNASNDYTYNLKPNETLEFYTTKFNDIASFSGNVKFEAKLLEDILPNQNRQLLSNEYIVFYNKPTNNSEAVYEYRAYGEGAIINSSIQIAKNIGHVIGDAILPANINDWKLTEVAGHRFREANFLTHNNMSTLNSESVSKLTNPTQILSGSRIIKIKSPNQISLDSSNYCYWVLNSESIDDTYTLFNIGETERILHTGEYLIYTDALMQNMATVGAGTKITRRNSDTAILVMSDAKLEDILELGAFSGYFMNPPADDPFICVNNTIEYFANGNSIKLMPKYSSAPANVTVSGTGISLWTISKTGDGTTTLFILEGYPEVIEKVTINGAETTAYSLMLSQEGEKAILFNSAPANGSEIIIYIKDNPLSKFIIRYNNLGETDFSNQLQDVVLTETIDGVQVRGGWDAQTLLELNMSKDVGQILETGQTIKLYSSGGQESIITGQDRITVTVTADSEAGYSYTFNQSPIKLFSDYDLNTLSSDKLNLESLSGVTHNITVARNNYVSSQAIAAPLTSGGIIFRIQAADANSSQKTEIEYPVQLKAGDYIMEATQASDEVADLRIYFATLENDEYTKIDGTDVVTVASGSLNLSRCNNQHVKFTIPEEYDGRPNDLPIYIVCKITLLNGLTKLSLNSIITLYNPMKYVFSTDIPANKARAYALLIKKFDANKRFDYMYEPSVAEYIKNPLDAASFVNTNHICNKHTICLFIGNIDKVEVISG